VEKKSKSRKLHEPTRERLDRLFQALPPLHSSEYLEVLEKATAEDLPAPVLVRAYRQLAPTTHSEAIERTLERLLDARDRYGYLKEIRILAKWKVAKGHYEYDENDLLSETLNEIVKVLPTKSGEMAEQAWVTFCRCRLEDVRRRIQGRKGNKDLWRRTEMVADKESGRLYDPLDRMEAPPESPDGQIFEDKHGRLTEIIRETIQKIKDPLTRRVAEDQFGDDPSPISAGPSASGKPSLEEQLGVDRDKINRVRRKARARIAAKLLQLHDPEFEFDRNILLRFVRGNLRNK